MKTTSSSLATGCLLLLAMSATGCPDTLAKPVTPAEALLRAGTPAGTRGGAPELAGEIAAGGCTALYLFNLPEGGWRILSADDAAAPVAAWSDEGTLDMESLPDNLRGWLDGCADDIVRASAGNGMPYQAPGKPGRAPIAPLLTSKWNQNDPYNRYCPETSGLRCVTGCVATAMAQVMYYHKWPLRASGDAVFTNTVTNTTADFSNFEFDWAHMLDRYQTQYSQEEADAVARLMQACGYSIDMRYSPSSSGATSELVGAALTDAFGYDASLRSIHRAYHSEAEWDELIYNDLLESGPVLYWGMGTGGGHCFVLDGCDGNGYYHFNWGWAGMGDGYFLLTNLAPASQGIGGNSSNFNGNQGAITGIRPATETASEKWYTWGITDGFTNAAVNGTYVYLYGEFINLSPHRASGSFILKIYNQEGTEEVGEGKVYVPAAGTAFSPYSRTGYVMGAVPNTIGDGTYLIKPVFRCGETDYPMLTPPGVPDYIVYTREGRINKAEVPRTPGLVFESATTNGDLFEGKPLRISGRASYMAEGDREFTLTVLLLNPDGSVRATGDTFTHSFSDRGNDFDFISGWFNDRGVKIEPGTWTVALATFANGQYKTEWQAEVNVRDGAPARGEFEVVEFGVDNSTAVDPMSVTVRSVVRGTGGVAYEDIYAYVFKGMAYVKEFKTPVYVSEGQESAVIHNFSLPNAVQGEKYNVYLVRDIAGKKTYITSAKSFTIGDLSGIGEIAGDSDTPTCRRVGKGTFAISPIEGQPIVTVLDIAGQKIAYDAETDGSTLQLKLRGNAPGVVIIFVQTEGNALPAVFKTTE